MGLTRIRAEQISDIDYKQAVRVITVANVTLSGGAPSTVDGVTLVAGDRILVAGQSTGSQNGLYDVVTLGTGLNGTWARTADGDVTGEIEAGMIVMVTEGNVYKDTQWKLTTNNPIVIGTTALTFEQNSAFAFGNIFANGTAVLANTMGSTVTLTAGDNIAITGNNTTKTVTIGVTGISLNSISNGTSNVNVVSSGGNVTVGIGGTSNVAVFSTAGVDVTGRVSASGNVTGGNMLTSGLISATSTITSAANVTGGNLLTAGVVSAGGNITGANVNTGGLVTATGNVTGGNINTAGVVSATGNVNSGNINTGIVSGSGNVTGANFRTAGLVTATGNVTGGNILTAGLISATSTITSAANITGGNLLTGGLISATSTITSAANITGGNVLTGGFISATGNVTGGNLNTAGVVSSTGNVNGGNVNTGIVSGSGNVTGANLRTAGLVTATGNVTGGNILTAGLISATSTITSAANISGGNILTGGLISATGAITASSITVANVASALTQTPTVGYVLEPSFQPNYIGTQPFSSSMWVDKLRFIQPNTVETSTDGVVWSASTDTNYTQKPFNGLVTQSTIAMNGTTLKGLRWTWSANLQYSSALWLGIAFQYSSPSPTCTVQLETSTDGVSWTSRYTTSAITVGNEWVYIYTPENSYSTQYYRITLLQQTNTVNFNAVQWYTARPGDQGSGLNAYFPFTYDFSKNVTFSNTVSATANITGSNLLTGGSVTATGNVTGGNVNTAGVVSATGNVNSGNVNTAIVSGSGNITGANFITAGLVTATGNVTGGNILTGGLISATGNITGGNVLGGANVNATTHTGTTVSVTGNIDGGNLRTAGLVTATGNIQGGNLLTGGLISATSSITSAAGITGTGNVTGGNLTTAGLVTAGGNVTGGNILTGGLVTATGNVTGANILTAGAVSATGNVTGGNVVTGTVTSTGALTITSASNGHINIQPNGTGNIVLNNTYINSVRLPVQDQDAASKIYVDNLVSTAISYHQPVTAATTTTLATTTGGTITYNNGTNGVGATLTTTGSFNLIDTANVQTANTRILVKDEGNAALNGVYVWSNATVITRSSDTNTYGAGNVSALGLNDYFFVSSGNVNKGSAYIVSAPTGTITFGVSNITFAQFSSSQTYTANTSAGISLTGTVFSALVDNNTTAFDAGGNIIVKASANLTTPNIGAATGTSLSVTGNVTGGNLTTGGLVTATGNVTGGNVTTAGLITATGNVTGGNLNTAGAVSATGNVNSGNVNTAIVSGSGNITGANFRTTGLVTATGNITGGNILTAGLISATSTITSAANVTGGNLTTAGLVTATGNIQGGNLLTGGLISATSTITSAANVTGANLTTAGLVTATGNIQGGNLRTSGLISAAGNITAANASFVASNVTVTVTDSFATASAIKSLGVVSGVRDVFLSANIGAGSYNNLVSANDQGLIFTGPQQGNANLTIAPWASATSGIRISSISNTANITLAATTTSATGNLVGANLTTAGLISATGNIQGGNLLTAGLISATSTITAAANISGGNILTGGLVSATGNVTGGNINTAGAVVVTSVTPTTSTTTGTIRTAGGVGVAGNVHVGGALVAVTKSFAIQHPDREDAILFHGCLEGPEHAVYVRGRCRDRTISLPAYWTRLVDPDSVTVHLTAIGASKVPQIISADNQTVRLDGLGDIDCYYMIYATRRDVPDLAIEVAGSINDLYKER